MNARTVITIMVVLAIAIFIASGCEKKIPRMMVEKGEYDKTAIEIAVSFSSGLKRSEKSQYWITIVEAGVPDYEWGFWQPVRNNAVRAALPLPKNIKPGKYEVRLHADFPERPYHVIDRKTIMIR